MKCDYWLYQLSDFITIEQELLLNNFLQIKIPPYLVQYEGSQKNSLSAILAAYRKDTDEDTGLAFLERRKLE